MNRTEIHQSKIALEFDKIIDIIAVKCVSETGRIYLRATSLFKAPEELGNALAEVQDLREVYVLEGGYPIWDFADVRVFLNKIEPAESYLEVDDFLKLQNFLELIGEGREFSKKMDTKYPHLQRILRRLIPNERLVTQCKFTFEPSGRVFDNASPDLKAIRKMMKTVDQEIHIRLERIVKKQAEFLQEEYLTLRDGRFVIPVREFSVTKVPGIVHGQSQSGATYFVEPTPVVELNNEMQKLLAAERKEIIKILKRLSQLVRDDKANLLVNFRLLNDLDVLQAKARYANEFKCVAPQISEGFDWKLVSAKHPLLFKMHAETTIPLNLEIGGENHVLLISGPNAGGKTVALKTIGLLQLLFQSGFHIPAHEGSHLPICENIFTVIGDDQSIENDLSTFSSHIRSLKGISDQVRARNLVLIDEIGSGTEPTGGAALAIALLEKLNRAEIVTVATTHQNQIKAFASSHKGFINAAMQFDTASLTPLFTLQTGIPGSSYTFDICRRLGLNEEIIRRASEIAGDDTFRLDKLLSDASEQSRKYHELASRLSIRETELNGLSQLYLQRSEELKKKRRHFEEEAKQQARLLLQNINRDIEAVIKEIRESNADKQVVRKGRERIEELRQMLDMSENPELTGRKPSVQEPSVGQRVRSVQYGITGSISKVYKNKNEVEIEREGLKITVSREDIELLDDHGQALGHLKPSADAGSPEPDGGVNIINEVDLRGLTVDEALRKAEGYLDLAVNSSWNEVRLIHGKGTGALRQAIHEYLRGLRIVKRYRLGGWGEGDIGVTVVTLK
jgi:DNA mismatch repair protein MutS2